MEECRRNQRHSHVTVQWVASAEKYFCRHFVKLKQTKLVMNLERGKGEREGVFLCFFILRAAQSTFGA